jgi:hypothetical protein
MALTKWESLNWDRFNIPDNSMAKYHCELFHTLAESFAPIVSWARSTREFNFQIVIVDPDGINIVDEECNF